VSSTTGSQRAPRAQGGELDGSVRMRFVPSFPLVDAKLYRPVPGPGFVPRSRLIGLLTGEPRASTVSIVAPAGYGKTLLLSGWAAHEQRSVAWLTLDDFDNEPSVFLTYLAAALDRVEPIDGAMASALAAHGTRILGAAVPRLAAELHRWHRPGLLILDDVHRLVDRTCLDALEALLAHLPPGFQMALAARTRPDLPFGRFRADRSLLEIDRNQLAFDAAETEALTLAAGHPLSPEEARSLAARTEGWAAAIYLATLARERGGRIAAGIDDVSGRDGYIAEYLRSELRPHLDEDDVTLLARTSILEVVEPRLATAVAGLPGAPERLRSLARENQLVVEVAGAENAYRYHHLLREYLRGELEQREPGLAPELHRRAASWYTAEGRSELAIEHSIASGEVGVTARLVAAATVRAHYGGHGDRIVRWLRSFDEPVFVQQPSLAVVAAWMHALNGRPEAADRMADIVERSAGTREPEDGSASFESSRAMLRAAMARHGPDTMLADATVASDTEGPGSPWRSVAYLVLGSAHLLRGDPVLADAAFAEAVDAAETTGVSAYVSLASRACVAVERGDWRDAERFAREGHDALARAHLGDIVTTLLVHAASARVAIHRGDLVRGREELVHAQLVRPQVSHALPWVAVEALLELGRSYLAIGDPAGARSAVSEAEHVLRRRPDLGILPGRLAELRRRLDESARTLAGPSTLTPAELRVLPMLSTHLTFEEIGDRLGVSRYTVKSQAMAIYGKLEVSSRSEAIDRAIEIGLLEPFTGLRLSAGSMAD
jgi:LuxR family transcriptional regulator, maltose regulon positive regulatory protein